MVTANVRGRDLASFVSEVQERVGAEIVLPEGYWIQFGGTFEQLISATQRLSIVVPLVLALHGRIPHQGIGPRYSGPAAEDGFGSMVVPR